MTNQHSHHATSHSSVALGTGDLSHRRLGDFEIVRMIGRGGMGVVYEARQISLDRTVALKVLTGGVLASEHHIIRFQREAQAAAKLKHDNIVPIYAQDQQDGIYYYAMELVEGESLSQILKLMRANSVLRRDHGQTTAGATQTIRNSPTSKALSDQSGTAAGSSDITLTLEIDRSADQQSSSQLSPNTARRADSSSIFQQQFGHNLPDYFNEIAKRIAELADALFYAHTHHIIHRDIKPHNLIRDDSGRLRITDFGLSRMTSEPGVTLTGEFIGSPAYMSPEQMTGSRGNMDHRTDIYSLGATLYEWLTLQPPHPGDTPEQVIAHATTQEIIPPHQINRFVPVDLETICLKALAKHPNDRYASAADMADDLRRFVRGQAILARRAGPVERFIKMIRRHRVLTAASAVIILLTVIVAGLLRTNVQSEQTHQTHVQAIATERDQFKEEADLAKVEAEQLKQQLELLKDLVGFTQETGAVLIEAGPQIGQRLESIAQLESQPQPAKDSASKPSKTGDMLSTVAGSAGTMLSSVLQLPEVPQRQILSGSLAYEMVRRWRQTIPKLVQEYDPNGTPAANQLFWLAVSAQEPSRKIQLLNEALRQNPGDAASLYLRSLMHCNNQNFSNMCSDANALIDLKPDSEDALSLCAASRILTNHPDEAWQMLRDKPELTQRSARLLAIMGYAELLLDKHTVARNHFIAATELNHNLNLAHIGLSQLWHYQGQYQQALEHIDWVLSEDTLNPYAYLARAVTRDVVLDFAGSTEDYTRVMELGLQSKLVKARRYFAIEYYRRQQQQAHDNAQIIDRDVDFNTPDITDKEVSPPTVSTPPTNP